MSAIPLLTVRDLAVELNTPGGRVRPVDGVSLTLARGEIMGLVGESGSGKTLTCRALMGLLPEHAAPRVTGAVEIEGRTLDLATPKALARVRGHDVAMIFQNPSSYLDPLMPAWRQIAEPMLTRNGVSRKQARAEAVALMRKVGIPDPEGNAGAYPHQLSGGMKQRVMIAAALACRPKLLIADEPTTALDVTVQLQILRLLVELRKESGLSIILVTHDLAVISMICDTVYVMYCGKIMERGGREAVLRSPAHPYTRALVRSEPSWMEKAEELQVIPGQLPPLHDLPDGCRFYPRCEFMVQRCALQVPELRQVQKRHLSACLRAEEVLGSGDSAA